MNRVYDREKAENLNELTGISPNEEKAMEARAGKGAKHDLAAKEKEAADARSAAAGNELAKNSASRRESLSGQEKGGLYKPIGSDEKTKPGSFRDRLRSRRVKLTLAGLLSGLIGTAGGLGVLGTLSGPLQFIQASKFLQGIHLDPKSDQQETRLLALVRYASAFRAGAPQDARLSVLGKRIAPKAEARFNKIGFESGYGPLGGFRGYMVDPQRVRGGVFDKMTDADRTPQGFADFLQREFGINAGTTADGRVTIDATQSGFTYKVNKRLMKQLVIASGASRVSASINARYAGQRAGIGRGWHPVEKLDRKILLTIEDRYKAWIEKREQNIERGSGSVRPGGIEQTTNEEGNPNGDPEAVGNGNETVNEANNARTDRESFIEFRDKLAARAAGPLGVLGLLDIVCLLFFAAERAEELQRANVDLPSQRLGVELVALGSQLQDGGVDLDGESEQIGWWAEKMNDKETRTSFFDALSLHRASGRPGGEPLPPEYSIGPSTNPFVQFFNNPQVNAIVGPACRIISNTVIAIALVVGGLLLGPVSAVVGTILGAVASIVFIETVAHLLAGNQIDVEELAGSNLGGVADQGVFSFANNQAIGNGSIPMTPAQTAELEQINRESLEEDFRNQSLAYRMLEPTDPHSLFGQVIQSQAPDPSANVANFAYGFLNIGKTFGSLLSRPLQVASVGAAPIPHNYGQPNFAFTAEEMADPTYEMPYDNSTRAVGLLEAQAASPPPATTATYVQRAKVCFGVNLEKRTMAQALEDEPQEAVWSISFPQEGEMPLYETIITGMRPASTGDLVNYGCTEDTEDWKTIRFFIFDNQVMNSYYCYEGDPEDPDTKQACIDIGIEPAPNGGSSGVAGPAPTCSGTGNSGGAITGPGPLNNPIPANPVIDPISASVVAEFPAPSYVNAYAYGQTVVCSSASDPVYNVSSGNPDWGPNAFDQVVNVSGGSGSCNPLHIPAGTQPPTGTDGWVVVIDSTKPGLYCVMWVASFDGSNWSMEYGGVYDLNGGGVPVLAGSGSGSDIPQSPILTSEIEAGVINHALGFASPKNASGFRAPATKSDGGGSGPFVEGMRFQLDPTFDCNAMPTKAEKAVCVALQVYGAYNVDNTGGGTGWFFQANDPNGVYPAAGITGDYMAFENIPMDRMRLLARWEGN